MKAVAFPLNSIVVGLVRPGGLPWAGIAARPRRTEGWQGLKLALGPIKVRWGLVLILALALLILRGELSPGASGIPTIR